MKKFLVVRDELEGSTVLCREVSGSAATALHEATTRYPDANRYNIDLLYGRDWDGVVRSYPKYADAHPV